MIKKGQLLNEATLNAAFMSKTADNNILGNITAINKTIQAGNIIANTSLMAGTATLDANSAKITIKATTTSLAAISAGSVTQSNYTKLFFTTDGGNLQLWKAGTAQGSTWGGNNSVNLYNSSGGVYLFSNNTETNVIALDSNGRVGIGTKVPTEKLSIATTSDGAATSRKAIGFSVGGWAAPAAIGSQSNGDKVVLYDNNSTEKHVIGIQSGSIWLQTSDGFNMYDNLGAAKSRIAVSSGDSYIMNGNFGIGTNAPSRRLEVSSDTTATYVKVASTVSAAVTGIEFVDKTSGGNTIIGHLLANNTGAANTTLANIPGSLILRTNVSNTALVVGTTGPSAPIIFYIDAPITAKEKMRITSTNVSFKVPIASAVADGTAPLTIVSKTLVSNLNADYLDGKHAPTGDIVGTTDTQTLSNKNFTQSKFNNGRILYRDPNEPDPDSDNIEHEYYVRIDGSDLNDGSANDSAHAFRTIKKAVSMIPDVSWQSYYINVGAGDFTSEGPIVIQSILGGTSIGISGTGTASTYVRGFIFQDVRGYITVSNLAVTHGEIYYAPISVWDCLDVYFSSLDMNSVGTSAIDIVNSCVRTWGLQTSNKTGPIYEAGMNAVLDIGFSSGDNNTTFVHATGNAYVNVTSDSLPDAINKYLVDSPAVTIIGNEGTPITNTAARDSYDIYGKPICLGATDGEGAVNYLEMHNGVTEQGPSIRAQGQDTNVDIGIFTKGNGKLYLNGGAVLALTQNVIQGSQTFNSTTGVSITHNIGSTNYRVMINPTSNPGGYLGEYWVTKSANSMTVYCSGSTTTTTFDYLILKY